MSFVCLKWVDIITLVLKYQAVNKKIISPINEKIATKSYCNETVYSVTKCGLINYQQSLCNDFKLKLNTSQIDNNKPHFDIQFFLLKS